jgi:hypothetical protein
MHPVSSATLEPIVLRQLRSGQFQETSGDNAEFLIAIQIFGKDRRTPGKTCTLVVEVLEPRSGALLWLGHTEVAIPEASDPKALDLSDYQVGTFLRAIPWPRALPKG